MRRNGRRLSPKITCGLEPLVIVPFRDGKIGGGAVWEKRIKISLWTDAHEAPKL